MDNDRAAVATSNRAFYRALASRDMRTMDPVWLHADWVGCVHPGWALLVGWKVIRQSWVDIFASGQNLQIMPSQVVIHIEKDLAWVTCLENITVHDEGDWNYSIATATNLFQRVNDEWKLIHHHASATPPAGTRGWHEHISTN